MKCSFMLVGYQLRLQIQISGLLLCCRSRLNQSLCQHLELKYWINILNSSTSGAVFYLGQCWDVPCSQKLWKHCGNWTNTVHPWTAGMLLLSEHCTLCVCSWLMEICTVLGELGGMGDSHSCSIRVAYHLWGKLQPLFSFALVKLV